MINDNTLYVSIDIETDGVVAGINNMLSLGATISDHRGSEVGAFAMNLDHVPGLKGDPKTVTEFWHKHPEAWARANEDQRPYSTVMHAFADLLESCRAATDSNPRLMAVCYPVAFDWPFINYYFHRCLGQNPLGYAALDIWSLWKGAGEPFPIELGNPHIAVEDARNQAALFFRIRRHMESRHEEYPG